MNNLICGRRELEKEWNDVLMCDLMSDEDYDDVDCGVKKDVKKICKSQNPVPDPAAKLKRLINIITSTAIFFERNLDDFQKRMCEIPYSQTLTKMSEQRMMIFSASSAVNLMHNQLLEEVQMFCNTQNLSQKERSERKNTASLYIAISRTTIHHIENLAIFIKYFWLKLNETCVSLGKK